MNFINGLQMVNREFLHYLFNELSCSIEGVVLSYWTEQQKKKEMLFKPWHRMLNKVVSKCEKDGGIAICSGC
jgi:hypothetical protein